MMATCRCVCTVYMHKKEPQTLPENTLEHLKSYYFLRACPQSLHTQSVLLAPLFVFVQECELRYVSVWECTWYVHACMAGYMCVNKVSLCVCVCGGGRGGVHVCVCMCVSATLPRGAWPVRNEP